MRDTVTAVEIDWEFTAIYTMHDTVTAVDIDWEFAAIYTMRDTVNAVEIGGIELIVCIFFIVTNLRF